MLEKAAAALAAGDWVRAEQLSREVLERAPSLPRALQLAAAVRLQQHDGTGAGELLQRALASDPNNPELLEGLGAAALMARNYVEAERWLRRAMGLGKAGAATLTWLGLALSSQGLRAEAVEIFRRAVAAAPEDPTVQLNLAHELTQIGEWQEAIAGYKRALRLKPDDAEGHDNLGAALLESGKGGEAAECFRRAILLAPENADYHADLGHALMEQQLWDEAIASYQQALTLRPDYPEALNSLGSVQLERGDPDGAIRMIRQAIALRPDYADGHANLGKALLALGRMEEAKACFEHAETLQPGEAARHRVNFAGALLDQGWRDDAVLQYVRALELDPTLAEAKWGLGTARLYRMEFEEAWPAYERRLEVRSFRNKHFRTAPASATLYDSLRHWRGPAEAAVAEVAIWAEQGIGDQVLFSTLIPDLIGVGVPLVYEMDPRLLETYRRAFPGVQFVARQEPPREKLQQASRVLAIGSLPGLFRRSREDFARQPAKLLSALSERVAHYRRRLDALGPGLKVAFSWKSTRKDWWVQKKKAVPLTAFVPLLKLRGVHVVDVQYGDTGAERSAVEASTGVRLFRFEDVDHFNDLEEVLAILEACDLLITTSNATAHFAGALGKRTWLLYLADKAPFHYWAHGGDHRCLWYPSVEIVTAPQLTEWASLIGHARERLDRELAQARALHDGSLTAAGGR
jgi:tetratricopeptide (TPR) repeat protein